MKKTRKKKEASDTEAGKKDLFVAGGIVLFCLVLFLPSLQNGFVNWDDPDYILNNTVIHHLTWTNLKTIFSGFYVANYHPFTTLSFALEYQVVGYNSPLLYHFNNLWIHLFNVLLVYWLIRVVSRNSLVAAVVAFWFGIHPMHVESVAWISERKDVLYAAFFLAGLISYYYYLLNSGNIPGQQPGKNSGPAKQYFIALLLFLFSLLSKSAAVVFPVVLWLVDFLAGRKFSGKMITEKIPFLALSLLFGILAIFSQETAIEKGVGLVLTPLNRFFVVNYAFLRYIWMSVVPAGMSAYHPYPVMAGGKFSILVYLSAFINLLLTGAVIYSLRTSRRYFFGFAFFVVTIFLVLQILPFGGAILSERYTYLPYIGLFFIAGHFMVSAWNNPKLSTGIRYLVPVAFILFSLLFTIISYNRIRIWKDSDSLFSDVIRKYPDNYLAYSLRGTAKMKDDPEGALEDFDASIARYGVNPLSYNNRGNIYLQQKKFREALQDYNSAISSDPKMDEAYNNRGAIKGMMGDLDGALADFNRALELKPDYADAYRNRGFVEWQKNEKDAARADWQKAVELGDQVSAKMLQKYRQD
jgi:protein O-mannosyl-transferase